MTREEAYQTLTVYTKSQDLIRHHLAAEVAMKTIAKFIIDNQNKKNIDIEEWGIVGLLHDADYELTRNTPERHTLLLEEKIGATLPADVMHAIKAHNYKYTGVELESLMDWAMYTCDELTGFVIACALIQKDREISSVTSDFVIKKMKESSFAKSVDRNQINLCEEKLNISLFEYVGIVLNAMKEISPDLGFE